MKSFDSNRPDFAPYGFTCVRWHPTPMRRPDRHNEIELNFLETGWVTYLLGGHKIRVEAGYLTAFWAAIPHQIIAYGNEPEYFVATMPLAWFLQSKFPDNLRHALLQGRVIRERKQERVRSDALLFANWERDLRKPRGDIMKTVLLEMEARLLRLAMGADHSLASSPTSRKQRVVMSKGGLNKVEQMACLIAQRYTERLTVGTIGKAVGLHPNYAMSLFQKAFGTTLIDYMTQHRVSHAQRLLATSGQKILEIALDAGFGSISRFNAAFKQSCRCSPRQYRDRHRVAF